MNDFTTPDLFDDNRETVKVAEAGLLHFGGKQKFYGKAVTVTCPDDNSKAVEVLKEDGEGKVLVIDGFASFRFAFIGDQMAELAVKNNWQGVIVNGCVRDIEILATMPLAVMGLGSVPRSTLKKGVGERGNSVNCLSLTIEQGDFLYADVNGLVSSKTPLL